jgi:phosphate transport system substrate-binding protein
MKKFLKVFVIILFIITVIGLCYYSYLYFTNKLKVEEKISNEPVFTIENYPKFDSSTATQILAMSFMRNFTGQNVETSSINFSKTHEAYVKLINKEVDIILVTQPSTEELALAKETGMELEVIPVVKEGFVFYVNKDNIIDDLTVSQIQDIYSGKVKKWSEIGGSNLDIIPYQRPVNSGSQTGMLELVMKDKKIMEAPVEYIPMSMAEIINLVASYKNQAAAIGYSYYYYATTMYQEIDKDIANSIKLLGINGIKPNENTIKSGEYPFTTSYYIVIDKSKSEDSDTRKLVNLMLSTRGQKVAKEAGYVPVK